MSFFKEASHLYNAQNSIFLLQTQYNCQIKFLPAHQTSPLIRAF